MISKAFINYASEILADTNTGLTGSQIVKLCSKYAIEYNVDIPYPEYPFPKNVHNKRTALKENLKAFTPEQQFRIIRELCELEQFNGNKDIKKLKIKLISRYGHLSSLNETDEIDITLIEETKHWLKDFPESLDLYKDALDKYKNNIFKRNLIDDLRLSLEKLLQIILNNHKSLENQLSDIGNYIKNRNGSKQFSNMFIKLIDYYSKYQNAYIKHDDLVNENEIEFIIEITSSFMKYLIKIQ